MGVVPVPSDSIPIAAKQSTSVGGEPKGAPAAQDGQRAFIDWLLSLPGVAAFALESDGQTLHSSPALLSLLVYPQADATAAGLARLVGSGALDGESLRRAAVSCGPRDGESPRRIWAIVPVEADSGEILVAGLHVGPVEGATTAAQEGAFRAALQEPDRRHGINQPLTALSFLLENLLHAFMTSAPTSAYCLRKAADFGQQIAQLRTLLPVDRRAEI